MQFCGILIRSPTMGVGTIPGEGMNEEQQAEWLWKKQVRSSLNVLQALIMGVSLFMLVSLWAFHQKQRTDDSFHKFVVESVKVMDRQFEIVKLKIDQQRCKP